MSVAFPPEIERFVDEAVSSGVYSSRDELIVAAVGLLQEKEAALASLRAEIDKGWDGEGIPMEEAFAQLRALYAPPAASDAP